LIAKKYNRSRVHQPGRPPVMKAIKALIVRLALENSGWGCTRIKGALDNLGHQVGRSAILRSAGAKPILLPARSPNLNAFAELFARSIRPECLDKTIFLAEDHPCSTITQDLIHYQRERNRQGLVNTLVDPEGIKPTGQIRRRKRIGGLLN